MMILKFIYIFNTLKINYFKINYNFAKLSNVLLIYIDKIKCTKLICTHAPNYLYTKNKIKKESYIKNSLTAFTLKG